MQTFLSIFRLRQPSFARAASLLLVSFIASMRLAGFPDVANLHGTHWQWAMVALALYAMVENARCLRPRWSLYHAGVLITLYTNLMILAMVVFFALYQ